MRTRKAVVALVVGLGLGGPAWGVQLPPWQPSEPYAEIEWSPGPGGNVPYVPTPQPVVDKMLEVAGVGPEDVLYDLGSGDGRIVVTAAKRFGVRGVGIDINPERIEEAEENARREGVEALTDFRQEDLFQADFSEATVVTMYLLPSVNDRLKPRLLSELRPGTRIVSHAFDIDGWEPERTVDVDGRTLYVWTVPENPSQAR